MVMQVLAMACRRKVFLGMFDEFVPASWTAASCWDSSRGEEANNSLPLLAFNVIWTSPFLRYGKQCGNAECAADIGETHAEREGGLIPEMPSKTFNC